MKKGSINTNGYLLTLITLTVGAVWFLNWLVHQMYDHDKKNNTTLNKPLDNKGKWWYN